MSALPAAASPVPGTYRSVAPARLLDTRSSATRPTSGTVLHVPVLGRAGVSQAGVAAVFLHVTAAAVRVSGYLSVYPGGSAVPTTSTLNVTQGLITSNNTLVAPGGNGAIDIRVAAATDVVVDLLGWTVGGAPGGGDVPAGGMVPLAPTRLLDTRGHGPLRSTGLALAIPQVPADAAAVVLNLTTVNSSGVVQVVSYPAGAPRTTLPAMHAAPGRATAALDLVGLGAGGVVALATNGGATDLVVDLLGYVAGGTAGPGGLVATNPQRVLDTRTTHQPLGRTTIVLAGHAVPADAQAVLVTLTSVPNSRASGYVVSYADGDPVPPVSMVNPLADAPVASQQLVPVGPDGGITVQYSSGSGDVVVDVNGYVRARLLPPVQPAVLSQADTSPLADGGQESRARSVLLTTNRYALQTWWQGAATTLMSTAPERLGQSDTADTVRRLAMEAFSLATSLATNAYDPAVAGVSTQTAQGVVAQIAARVACTHRANRVSGWGSSWQSSLWSSYAGRAAWLMWDSLPAATRTCVQRMVISESDFVTTLRPKYMVSESGATVTPGDTGAEEDSWYALAPALAIAMMPTAEQRDVWRRQEQQMLVAAWARPADTTSSTPVDGVPLATWLQGSNVLPTGVVINHNRIAPDYSTTVYQSVDTLEMAVLAGQSAPQASLAGLGPVYDALSTVRYAVPPYAAPGGAVVAPGTSKIYYPQGNDWGTGQQTPYALFDADADVFGFGNPADPVPAPTAAATHLAAAAAMQQRVASGAMYLSSTEYSYVGREEHTAQLAAQVYLAYFTKERLTVDVAPQPVLVSSRTPVPAQHAPPAARSEAVLRH